MGNNSKSLSCIAKILFLSLGAFPLMKENFNSLCIILFTIVTVIYLIKEKRPPKFNSFFFVTASYFFISLLYQIFSTEFNEVEVIKYLPFLILPWLFTNLPSIIKQQEIEKAIVVFQGAAITQAFIYLIIFLANNSFSQLFKVSQENIPFFREYVFSNYLFEIHPTYFSAFLLVGLTFSLFKNKNKWSWIYNILSVFFILLFSSRIIILILSVTLLCYAILSLRNQVKQHRTITVIILVVLVGGLFLSPLKNTVTKRFKEIVTEINNPVKGDYYNSTNTRMAILNCSISLTKNLPLFGYNNDLQDSLNKCYSEKYKSNFYTKSEFNTHNQYVNMLLFGGIFYLAFFLLFLYLIFKKVSYYLVGKIIFFQFILINLTENYFYRHYGIVTFLFTICVLITLKNTSYKARNTNIRKI